MEFVIEYTCLHNDGDYIYPDMGDITIHAPDRDSAIREFHEQYPSSSFIKYYIEAVHLIPHKVDNMKYRIENGINSHYLINSTDNDELTAIALNESDAQLVCDALNQYQKKDATEIYNQLQLDLFRDTD